MKKFIVAAAAAALLPLSASLQAKTICLNTFGNPSNQLKLIVSPLKKPGSVSAVKGIYRESGLAGPVTGSAMTNADGTITIGLTWHMMTSATGRDFTFGATGVDQGLIGGWSYSNDDDATTEGTFSTSALSCKDFTISP